MNKEIDSEDKNELKLTLANLIHQTYIVENEYKELNKSYQDLRHVIEQIIELLPHAIWVLQSDQNISLQNSAAKKISNLITKIDMSKEDYEIEFENRIYLINLTKSDDKTIISATDITQQRQKDRLASMGQVAAHLAHEIRNPIGSISILSSTLLKRVKLENKSIVLEIKKSLYRVERIIKSTLLFTKGVEIVKMPINLKDLKVEIENAYDNYSFSKDINLTIDFPDQKIYGDLETLNIVMQNFLYNAIDAIEEDDNESGEVSFTFQKEEKQSVIVVKDSGAAIENEEILYTPFKSTKTKGNGLGLALSLEIIKAHNGKISLLKKEKGFKIYIS
jgi:signal transduction histidine kinase